MHTQSAGAPATVDRYDGLLGADLAHLLGLPRAVALRSVGSTLDVAHAMAQEGAPAGTLIVADTQTAGRGRLGRSWRSEPGAGVWLTLIERPRDASALEVLSLRVGLGLAPALDVFAGGTVQLKWPNDLYVGDRKLGGILVEARWREGHADWVAIGVGVNMSCPEGEPRATGLRHGVSRIAVLQSMVRALRTAAFQREALDVAELRAFAERDLARGRKCTDPVAGVVRGIDASGALLVDPTTGAGPVAVRAGSLVLVEES